MDAAKNRLFSAASRCARAAQWIEVPASSQGVVGSIPAERANDSSHPAIACAADCPPTPLLSLIHLSAACSASRRRALPVVRTSPASLRACEVSNRDCVR